MAGKIYHINIRRKSRNTAGAKAPNDVASICNKNGIIEFPMPMFPNSSPKLYRKLWLAVVCTYHWMKLGRVVKAGDVVIYQHPMYGNRVAEKFIPRIQKKGCKFIALIHDLESLRKGIEGVIRKNEKTNDLADNVLLKHFDSVICHNEHMKKYMVGQGFDANKVICLDIFDYLYDGEMPTVKRSEQPSVAIAGNLAVGKCAYIYEIMQHNDDKKLQLQLFGVNYEDLGIKGMVYHGSFKPEELPTHLTGDFGLVWDGTSAATCAGNTGEYLKYNNPHKTSLYLASGMPVIVWKEAAMAGFVKDNGVGIVVESLYDIDKVISAVSDAEYLMMCENAKRIGARLREGYYFNCALQKCLQII